VSDGLLESIEHAQGEREVLVCRCDIPVVLTGFGIGALACQVKCSS